MGEPLAEELVGQAARPVLVPRRGLALADRRRVALRVLALLHLVGLRHPDVLLVVLAVPQLAVVPGAAGGIDARVLGGIGVAQVARHLLGRPQRAEIEGAAHRVRAVELDVVGVVLLALHDAVAVRIPQLPRVGERLLRLGPERPEVGVVARHEPLPVELHERAHLAVGRGDVVPEDASLERQHGAELLLPVGQGVVLVVGQPHGPLELREEERQRLGVVPDVGAVHRAAARVVVAPLEGVEAAVGGAETRRGADDGHLARDGVEHLGAAASSRRARRGTSASAR